MKTLIALTLLVASSTVLADGESLYKSACFACHDAGIAGAPQLGNKEQWAPRLERDVDSLVATVITGKGAMPPNGGTQMTQEQIKEVVEYMVSKVN